MRVQLHRWADYDSLTGQEDWGDGHSLWYCRISEPSGPCCDHCGRRDIGREWKGKAQTVSMAVCRAVLEMWLVKNK